MQNQEWTKRHIEHAEYNRDASLASADMARVRYRHYKRHADYVEWKENIRQAWAMRKIVRSNREVLK